jgi:hypothetical protein
MSRRVSGQTNAYYHEESSDEDGIFHNHKWNDMEYDVNGRVNQAKPHAKATDYCSELDRAIDTDGREKVRIHRRKYKDD